MNARQPTVVRIAYPEWTETNARGGVDPLGMQNSSVRLYQTLVPGISNVTLRIRYYGFYAWLADRYAREVGDTDPERWKRFIRRAEGLYALVAARQGKESGVAGIEWAHRRLLDLSARGRIDFEADTEPGSDSGYLKNAWGNFGAAYRGQLFEIGIFDHADHEIPLASRSIGKPLAQAFAGSIGDSADRFGGCMEAAAASLEDLDALQTCLPSAIDAASRERDLYQELLLGIPESTDSSGSAARRLTIRLLLRTTELLGRRPDAEAFRWALYSAQDVHGRRLTLTEPGEIEHRDRWWVYQANDLCQLACSTILKFVLDILEGFPEGVSYHGLVSTVVERIVEALSSDRRTWSAFAKGVPIAPNSSNADDPISEAALASEALEAGRGDRSFCTADQAATAVTLLAILQKRLAESRIDLFAIFGDPNRVDFRSVHTEVEFIKGIGTCDLPEALGRLVSVRILHRHLWVALKKLRYQGDYTFLIESDDGLLRLRGKDGPTFTNPRLRPTIGFLEDLQLIDEQGLAQFGREALAR